MDDITRPVAASEASPLLTAIANGLAKLDWYGSPQTMALMSKFGTDRVDMVELWMKTPQDFVCPGCGRGKADLVRLNSHGELMCWLVEHHDHMADALLEYFIHHSTRRDEVVATALGKAFAARSAPMVAAYDNTVVCVDCNNADATAKRMVGAPKYLSFSAAELRRFVIPRPNVPHDIDASAVSAVAKEVMPTFDIRMRFVNGVARIAASNDHWFQASSDDVRASSVRHAAARIAAVYPHPGGLYDLCGKRRAPNRSLSAWRTTVHPRPRRVPTSRDIEHVAKVDAAERWNALPADWTCPGCGRTKPAVVRTTRRTNRFSFLAEPRSFLPPSGRPDERSVIVCGDCSETGTALGKEADAIAGSGRTAFLCLVHISEVQAIVIPQPHGRHNIDARRVHDVLNVIADRLLNDDLARDAEADSGW